MFNYKDVPVFQYSKLPDCPILPCITCAHVIDSLPMKGEIMHASSQPDL